MVMMKKYGLIGNPLDHSLSARLFEERFGAGRYELHAIPTLEGLRAWALGLGGFNVTLPYKEAILPLLDEVDAEARAIGAVNLVVVREGRLCGYNTDAAAFADTLRPLLQPWHSEALILGTGGAAKAVAHALNGLGIKSLMVSRQGAPHLTYAEAAERARTATLIVNATPVGMAPKEAQTPWSDTRMLSPRHLCYDLIYNPEETRFLLESQLAGAQTANGMEMLRRQAYRSWQLWGLV